MLFRKTNSSQRMVSLRPAVLVHPWMVAASLSAILVAGIAAQPRDSQSQAEIRPYFTIPEGSRVVSPTATRPADALARYIDVAESRIDYCMFRFNHEEVRDALLRAHERGVFVRVFTDEDYWSQAYAQSYVDLIDAGIEVRVDLSPLTTVMHNKFVVFDGEAVWTGDWNVHLDDSYKSFHAAMYIPISGLAEQYARVFNRLWASDVPDTYATSQPTEKVGYRGSGEECTVQPFFPPGVSGDQFMCTAIAQAEESILIAHSYMSNRHLWTELVRAAERGVRIEHLYQVAPADVLGSLLLVGVDVRKGSSFLGCKFMIVDNRRLINGSWNAGAYDSDIENAVEIVGDRMLIDSYAEYFRSMFELAEPVLSEPRQADVRAEHVGEKLVEPYALGVTDPMAPRVTGVRVSGEGVDTVVSVRLGPGEGRSDSTVRYSLMVYAVKYHHKPGVRFDPKEGPMDVTEFGARTGVVDFALKAAPVARANVYARITRLESETGLWRVVGSYAIQVTEAQGG